MHDCFYWKTTNSMHLEHYYFCTIELKLRTCPQRTFPNTTPPIVRIGELTILMKISISKRMALGFEEKNHKRRDKLSFPNLYKSFHERVLSSSSCCVVYTHTHTH